MGLMSCIVIGDVHGCYKTLLKLIEQFPKDIPICFTGDLIDRGPRSKEVVEFVKTNHLCVRGNHEQMMIDNNGSWDFYSDWNLYNGGRATIESYDPNTDQKLFKEHTEWMKSLPIYLEFPDIKNSENRYLVVSHSSIGSVWRWGEDRRKEHKEMFENTIMWDRNPPNDVKEAYNVFGHTPGPDPRVKSFYANIDTGCCFTGRATYGKLTALQFPEMTVYQQANCE